MANVWSQDPEKQAAALRDYAIEFATFVTRFIEMEKIPPPKRVGDKEFGGVSLLAWSQGTALLLSFLSHIPFYDTHANVLLERYIRTVMIVGACDTPLSSDTGH